MFALIIVLYSMHFVLNIWLPIRWCGCLRMSVVENLGLEICGFCLFLQNGCTEACITAECLYPPDTPRGCCQKRFRLTLALHPLLLTSSGFIWLFSRSLIRWVLRGGAQLLFFFSFIISFFYYLLVLSLLCSSNFGTYLLPQLYC